MKHTIRLLSALLLAPLAALYAANTPAPGAKPNIVFVLIDDLGYGELSCHGNPVFQTPNMDRLHAECVRFTDFCVGATCSPTRAALMTGRHEFKSGVTHTTGGRERLALDAVTLPQLLKTAGYATGIFGKWHLGAQGDYRPERRGFDVSITTVGDTQNSHFDPTLLHNGARREHKGFREDILFNEAIEFIKVNRERPFFCYLPTYSPHAPLRAPTEYLERCKKQFPKATPAPFYAMISNVDDNLGRLLETLRDLKIENNTVVILMNDNGATYGVDQWNAGMRGCKGAAWFGGHRALSFWRWPGHWRPRDEGRLSAHVDVAPTLADLAGVKLPAELVPKLDGFSLRPLLESPNAPWNSERMLFQNAGRWPTGRAAEHGETFCGVRWRQMLLVRAATCGQSGCQGLCTGTVPWRTAPGYTRNFAFHYALTSENGWALFDVKADPACEHNLADAESATVARLRGAYKEWWQGVAPIVQKVDQNLKGAQTQTVD
ncbi:MAG: arylsulfatase [Candidatus Sumerlaeota bacterium]|nr:arylsulfatase [Candidatus Sumerlaeota bacterium]